MIGCYDSKREHIYAGHSTKGFGYLDIRSGEWKEIKGEGQPENLGTSSNTYMAFDSANGIIVWKSPSGPVIVYDPDSNKWLEQPSKNPYPDIPCPKYHVKYMLWHGFYHSQMNAHFFYLAGDSENKDANMVVYRYRRASELPPDKGKLGAGGKEKGIEP